MAIARLRSLTRPLRTVSIITSESSMDRIPPRTTSGQDAETSPQRRTEATETRNSEIANRKKKSVDRASQNNIT
jgi:hypothetical protein